MEEPRRAHSGPARDAFLRGIRRGRAFPRRIVAAVLGALLSAALISCTGPGSSGGTAVRDSAAGPANPGSSTGAASPDVRAGPASPSPTAGSGGTPATPATDRPAGRAAGSTATLPPVTDAVSLPALMRERYDGGDLRTGRVLRRDSAYTRYFATYRSGSLRISGILNVPRGKGPFPALVLAHGYIDPAVYRNGQGLIREQDYLARRGFLVLHTDYRNHAQSDRDPRSDEELRLGYTRDVVNAVLALQKSRMPSVDKSRIGLLGRSMGGGIVYNVLVTQPDLVDAAVAYAPVSADTVDNVRQFILPDPGRRELVRRVYARYGTPERNPGFWRNTSASTFFSRVNDPLLVQHGTSDATCPVAWSRKSVEKLRDLGKSADLITYQGEGHAFGPSWPESMRRTVDFFRRNLRT